MFMATLPTYRPNSIPAPASSPWAAYSLPAAQSAAPQAFPQLNTDHLEKTSKAEQPKIYTIQRGQPASTWPPIFQAISKQSPGMLEAILNQAGQVAISIPKRPPEDVIKALEAISIQTQETFISTWLPRLIEKGEKPIITAADRAKAPQVDFDALMQKIKRYADSQVQISAPGAEPTLVASVNAAIAPLRKKIMASNIEFESYNERAKTAKGIFYSVAGTTALGYAIEYVPFLKFLNGFKEKIMSQVDDYGNWAGEVASVKGQGYSWGQVAASQCLALPAIAWTMLADLQFREKTPVLDKNGEIKKRFGKPLYRGIHMDRWQSRLLRGMKFGLACGVLSIFASISTLMLMVYQHRKLTHEGKTQDSGPKDGLQGLWHSCKEAFRQDIQYPARVGLFIGSALATALCGAAALIKKPGAKGKGKQFLLSMVLVQALAGIGETVGATLASLTARKRNERHIDKIIAEAAHDCD
jgi:hypothetical protein